MSEQRAFTISPQRMAARPAPALAIYVAAFGAIALWSGTAIVTKIAVGAFDPLIVAMLRSTVAALALLPAAPLMAWPAPRDSRGRVLLLASALGGFVGFPLLYSLGLQLTTASHAVLILAVQPIMTGSIAFVAERRLPGSRWVLGSALALVGEVALIGFRVGLDSAGGLAGDLMIIASGFCASFGYVTGSRLSHSIGTWATTAWCNLLGGALMAVPLAILARDAPWHDAGFALWGSVAYLALCSSIIAYVAWYWALAKGGVARIGAVQFANPVFTPILAMLILGERITLPLVLAGAVILVGIYLAQKR